MTDIKEKRPRAIKKTAHEIENVRKISKTKNLTIPEYAEILGMSYDGARQLLINHNIPYISTAENNNTLCWSCQNNECSWHKKFKPVEGWEAIETELNRKGQTTLSSYLVTACPEFIADDAKRIAYKKTLLKIFYEIDTHKTIYTQLFINAKMLKTLTDYMDLVELEKLTNLKITVAPIKNFRLE